MFGVGAPSVLRCWYLAVAFPEGWRQQLRRGGGSRTRGRGIALAFSTPLKKSRGGPCPTSITGGLLSRALSRVSVTRLPFCSWGLLWGDHDLYLWVAHTHCSWSQFGDEELSSRGEVPEHRPPSPLTCPVCWLFPSSLRTMTLTDCGFCDSYSLLETPTQHIPLCDPMRYGWGRVCPEIKKARPSP